MQVRILPFGILKESLGSEPFALDLPTAATVADLLGRLGVQAPTIQSLSIAVSVNAEYADRTHVLTENDEVGLLPPVSGGSGADTVIRKEKQPMIELTRETMPADALVFAAKQGEDGAVVVFDGIVRNNSRGRQTLYLDYEAYEEMANKADERTGPRGHHPLRRSPCDHRPSPRPPAGGRDQRAHHRGLGPSRAAYEASRWLIDTLKKTVPIWKKETIRRWSGMGRWRAISRRDTPWRAPMALRRRRLAVIALLPSLLLLRRRRFPASPPRKTNLSRLDVKLVNIFVNVTDKTGAIVGGLTKDDFKITEDNRPQTHRHLRAPVRNAAQPHPCHRHQLQHL